VLDVRTSDAESESPVDASEIFAVPSNETPAIVRAVCNTVAVAALPVVLPLLPLTFPVTLPVRFPENVPVVVPGSVTPPAGNDSVIAPVAADAVI
jgi:hypothetical protein